MPKRDIKWMVAVAWESIPSPLQDTIREYGWKTLLGAICMMAYFAYAAFKGTLGLPWEVQIAIGVFIFVGVAVGVHFVWLLWQRIRRHTREQTQLKQQLIDRDAPQIAIQFSILDHNYARFTLQPDGLQGERRFCIRLENTSSRTIEDVDVFCEEIESVNPASEWGEEWYELLVGGESERPRSLRPGEQRFVGIVRFFALASDPNNPLNGRVDLVRTYKGAPHGLRGTGFLLSFIVVGDQMAPKRFKCKIEKHQRGCLLLMLP